eukprot:Hpha_TRINITY_DN3934_c0_g1::TRINITY_DN3934_c0_g1_i1::g.18008::m.18008
MAGLDPLQAERGAGKEDTLQVWCYPVAPWKTQAEAEAACGEVTRQFECAPPRGWLWHRDRLCLRAGQDGEGGWRGEGELFFGESADDEWAAVAKILAVSAAAPDLLFRVTDGDGQFLLVEAADILPHWMDPEGMDHRLWLRSGRLEAIPPTPQNPAQCPHITVPAPGSFVSCPPLPLPTALRILRGCGGGEFASPMVQGAVEERCAEVLKEGHTHWARCILPTEIACALTQQPQLVSHAVLSLCESGATGQSHAKRMKRFAPSKAGTSTVAVCFTRILYAMLRQHTFVPPGAHFSVPDSRSPEHIPALLGARLACGWEIAYQKGLLEEPESSGDCEMAHQPRPSPGESGADPVHVGMDEGGKPVNPTLVSHEDSFKAELARTRAKRADK